MNRDAIESRIPYGGECYDVIVVGGGVAGFGAALASGMMGAKTLLLEAHNFLGGIASSSLWMPLNRMLLHGVPRGGVPAALIEKLKSYGDVAGRIGKITRWESDNIATQPEYLNLAMFELLEQYGCDYRLNSQVTGAIVDNGSVKKVQVAGKYGNEYFGAKVFIDCSGDGDLSYYAGAKTQIGDDENGQTMPATLGFSLANVDTEPLFEFYDGNSVEYEQKIHAIVEQADRDGYVVSNWYSFDRTTIPGIASVNNGGWNHVKQISAEKVHDLTFLQRVGLKLAVDFVQVAKKYHIPGLENCYLDRVGAAVGIRETRVVTGDYVLQFEDVQQGQTFDRPIAHRYGFYGRGIGGKRPPVKNGHEIPMEALFVKGLDDLMVAGRCGSFSHAALPAGKSMGNMMMIGQAAGIIAALANRLNVLPRDVSYDAVIDGMHSIGVDTSNNDW